MAKPTLTKTLQFERKNQNMTKLPKYARVQKRPIPHAPVASPHAGPSIPKIVYVSTTSPFMGAVKRVQKLLRQAEKRALASVVSGRSSRGKTTTDKQRLAILAREQERLSREEVFVKATGRAIEKALCVGRWFEDREAEYAVRVKTGSVLVVDDVVEDEEVKRKAIEKQQEQEQELQQQQQQQQEQEQEQQQKDGDDHPTTTETAAPSTSKSATKKRKRAAKALAEDEELPETRTRWVNMVEIAITLK